MLVLTRHVDQTIVIGDGVTCPRITLLVVAADRGQARIGIECPRGIPIWRSELLPDDGATPTKEPKEAGE